MFAAFFVLLVILSVFIGVAYLVMVLCKRFTKGSEYEKLANFLIFAIAFCLITGVSVYIFLSNLTFDR